MAGTITVRDETTGTLAAKGDSGAGGGAGPLVLEFFTERITVRELIRSRVYQEVQDYNRCKPGLFRGLVQPSDAEIDLNGYKLRQGREISWGRQFDAACDAFEQRGFLILVGERQMTDLHEEIVIGPGAVVTFLKLVPLVGG